MVKHRKLEIFSAGCLVCNEMVESVKRVASPSCEIVVHNMNDMTMAKRAKELGILSVPSMVVDGNLTDCSWMRLGSD